MTKVQFWILLITSFVVGDLLVAQYFMARQLTADSQQLANMQVLASHGGDFSSRWQNIAIRTFQLSQQDPELKAILKRHNINVEPKNPPPPDPQLNPVQPTIPSLNPAPPR